MHKNIYLRSPELLSYDQSLVSDPDLFFAGQITGVEGYVESAASGILAGVQVLRRLQGKPPIDFPAETVIGALSHYVVRKNVDFQPMNANYGIVRPVYGFDHDKKAKKAAVMERSLSVIEKIKEQIYE